MTRADTSRCVARRGRPRGFSLLETTIAVGILGVGLIMVAAVFPAALTQHRLSVEQSRAAELVSKAESLLNSRYNRTSLWVDPAVSNVVGLDSPWYLLPTVNVSLGAANWLPTVGYTETINGINAGTVNPITNPPNPLLIFGLDLLSDRVAPFSAGNSFSPFTDEQFMALPNRLAWYGFYRREAPGTTTFATAICKQRRNQIFVEQDLSVASPYANPTANLASAWRLPVPWRVTVGYVGGNIIANPNVAPIGLTPLAPVGTKLMIHGAVYGAGPLPPAGRILTVSDSIDNFTVEVVGDLSGLPVAPFDVWVFPPSVENGDFGKESPLLDWKVLQ